MFGFLFFFFCMNYTAVKVSFNLMYCPNKCNILVLEMVIFFFLHLFQSELTVSCQFAVSSEMTC